MKYLGAAFILILGVQVQAADKGHLLVCSLGYAHIGQPGENMIYEGFLTVGNQVKLKRGKARDRNQMKGIGKYSAGAALKNGKFSVWVSLTDFPSKKKARESFTFKVDNNSLNYPIMRVTLPRPQGIEYEYENAPQLSEHGRDFHLMAECNIWNEGEL